MDEPFAGVDAATERAIVDVMRDVRIERGNSGLRITICRLSATISIAPSF